ncbi:MAG: hypothetical protein EOP84_10765 [Verrucomicrobiaceae bacterium]|nr:MAG: hypothetical protein EOP84_10765 [Verrucomicrobiaceae bacterium]
MKHALALFLALTSWNCCRTADEAPHLVPVSRETEAAPPATYQLAQAAVGALPTVAPKAPVRPMATALARAPVPTSPAPARTVAPAPAPTPAPKPAPASGGGEFLQCCDGTRSPTCRVDRASYRGCCSHHGGVC